ncbi:MAG TPA: hypothetical protein VKI00_04730, partial [Mycobacterium sp.]|uniref:hypothetical protein n=1 Tax=Mycobacterium sp. TaxID=1785 RepID=UPI002BACEC11
LHDLRAHLRMQLKQVRASSIPERNQPWPYASRRPPGANPSKPSTLTRLLRRAF